MNSKSDTILRRLQALTPAERLERNWRLSELAERLLEAVIIDEDQDGYTAYTSGKAGVIVGHGRTYEEVLIDIKSAVLFHVETFGDNILMEAHKEQSGDENNFTEDLRPPYPARESGGRR